MSDDEFEEISKDMMSSLRMFTNPACPRTSATREHITITSTINLKEQIYFTGAQMCDLENAYANVEDSIAWLNHDLIEVANVILSRGYSIKTGDVVYRDEVDQTIKELCNDTFNFAANHESKSFIMCLWDIHHMKGDLHHLCLLNCFYPTEYIWIEKKVNRCVRMFEKKYPLSSSLMPNLHKLIYEKHIIAVLNKANTKAL